MAGDGGGQPLAGSEPCQQSQQSQANDDGERPTTCGKSLGKFLLSALPPLPDFVMDAMVYLKVGRAAQSPPVVDRIRWPSPQGKAPLTERLLLDQLPPAPKGCLRLVFVSDTHERHRCVTLPPGDVLFHTGDLQMSAGLGRHRRGLRVLEDFNDWLDEQPFEEKVVIGGNHDATLFDLGEKAHEVLSAATFLQDSCVTLPVSGLRVYGNAFSEGHSHNQAWQARESGKSSTESLFGGLGKADVVLTHHDCERARSHLLADTAPSIWASGHIHAKHGARVRGDVLFVNAAIQDNRYQPLQPPVVVDFDCPGARA